MTAQSPEDVERAIETAWNVHSALSEWTGRVDAKASIVVTIEAAVLALVLNSSGDEGRFASDALCGDLARTLYWAGLLLTGFAILLAAGVVLPQLRRWKSRKGGTEWKHNIVYFGHLRHWDPADLKKELLKDPDALNSLSRQMVRMSEICWRKHSWAQASMLLALLGALAVVWCALIVT